MKKSILVIIVCGLLAIALTLTLNARNKSGVRHPNLVSAENLTTQAYGKLVAAQQANEWDLGGHAQKAKQLLEQAKDEIKQAEDAADQHQGK
jgi:hypothetical protein